MVAAAVLLAVGLAGILGLVFGRALSLVGRGLLGAVVLGCLIAAVVLGQSGQSGQSVGSDDAEPVAHDSGVKKNPHAAAIADAKPQQQEQAGTETEQEETKPPPSTEPGTQANKGTDDYVHPFEDFKSRAAQQHGAHQPRNGENWVPDKSSEPSYPLAPDQDPDEVRPPPCTTTCADTGAGGAVAPPADAQPRTGA